MKCRVCHQEKEPEQFPQNLSYKTGRATICRTCSNTLAAEYRLQNLDKKMAQKYKAPLPEIQRVLAVPHCEICGGTDARKRLCIDHCHTTGRIRGALCDGCNQAIGRMKDSPDLLAKAIEYLKKYA